MDFLRNPVRAERLVPGSRYSQALTLFFSRETLTIVNNLGLTEEERNDSGAIIAALKRHVDGHINECMERRKLRRRVQQQGESFDDYLVSLRELTKTCNFCSEERKISVIKLSKDC